MDRSTFDSELQALLAAANSRIPAHSLPDLPGIPGFPGVPGWHEEELALWNQGEAIRQLVRTAGKKLNRTQIAEILDICKNRNAGKLCHAPGAKGVCRICPADCGAAG